MRQPMNFYETLNQMQENFHSRKKRIEKLPRPPWLTDDDPLSEIYTEEKRLFAFGEIHYAALVQANSILFHRFPPYNCPANIIVGFSEYFDCRPTALFEIGHMLYQYKDRPGAPDDIREITDSITSEHERLHNRLLPGTYTRDQAAYFTTIMVYRSHLPRRTLIGPIFPVLSNPELLSSSTILPKRYWTKEFTAFYCGRHAIGSSFLP